MANTKFLKIVILILIIINIITLTFVWVNRPRPEFRQPQRTPGLFLQRVLHLTSQQQEQFFRIRELHQQRLAFFQKLNRDLHRRFFDLLLEQNPDSARMLILADSIAINQKSLDTLTYQHFLKMKRILDPEQQKIFCEIFYNVFVTIAPPPGPPNQDQLLQPPPQAPPHFPDQQE